MKAKNTNTSSLEKMRPIYFQIGLIISLSFTLIAFEWRTSEASIIKGYPDIDVHDDDNQIQIPIVIFSEPEPETKKEVSEKLIVSTSTEFFIVPDKEEVTEIQDLIEDLFEDFYTDEVIDTNEVFPYVGIMPCFKGCEIYATEDERADCTNKKIHKYLSQNFDRNNMPKISGVAYVKVVIGKNGKVKQSLIEHSSYSLLGDEAIRLMNRMPKWNPGRNSGRPVNVSLIIPINYEVN
ncbi:MAG: energy transducer TonB [Flavobacteriales bacterium]|nr:energy transducer TonB [Flavobacteriales bacterium]